MWSTPTLSGLLRELASRFGFSRDSDLKAPRYHPGSVMTQLASAVPKELQHLLSNAPELAGCYALWLASSKSADFLRGRYSSCNWVR